MLVSYEALRRTNRLYEAYVSLLSGYPLSGYPSETDLDFFRARK